MIPICGYPECYSEAVGAVGEHKGVEVPDFRFKSLVDQDVLDLSVRPACERHLSEAKSRSAWTFVMVEQPVPGYASFGSIPEPRMKGGE